MVGTVVLGIFPKSQHEGDVFLYVIGTGRILRLEVSAIESSVIASALLDGKNTLIKTSLEELRLAEIDSLLNKYSDYLPAGDDETEPEEDFASLKASLSLTTPLKRTIHHTYLESLMRLGARVHCIVLSGGEQIRASVIVEQIQENSRFSIVCPFADALALALYADAPVGVVPGLVQRAMPSKTVLQSVPAEIQDVLEAIMPSPEEESRLQKKMDLYNNQPLITVAGEKYAPSSAHEGTKPVTVTVRKRDKTGNGLSEGNQSSLRSRGSFGGKATKPDTRPGQAPAVLTATADNTQGNVDKADEEYLKKLLRQLMPETKVRM